MHENLLIFLLAKSFALSIDFSLAVFLEIATSQTTKLALIYSNYFSIDTAVANLSTGKLIKLHFLYY